MATWHESKKLWEARRRLPDGRRISKWGKTEQEAEAKADEAIGAIPKYIRDAGTVQEFIRLNIWSRQIKKRAENTQHQAKWALDHYILPAIGLVQTRDLQLHHCDEVLDRAEWYTWDPDTETWTKRTTPRSQDTVKTVRKHLGRITRLMARQKLIPYNYLEEIAAPKAKRRKSEHSIEQVRTLYEACKDDFPEGPFIFLAGFCGLTRGEALEVGVEDIGSTLLIEDQAVYSRKARSRVRKEELKTENRRRQIGIPPEFERILNDYVRGHSHVVRHADGRQVFPTSMRKMLHRACKKAGVPPITPHMLRATFMTALDDLGCPRRVLKALVGHADKDVTEGYLAPAAMREQARWLHKLWVSTAPKTSRHPSEGVTKGRKTSSKRA